MTTKELSYNQTQELQNFHCQSEFDFAQRPPKTFNGYDDFPAYDRLSPTNEIRKTPSPQQQQNPKITISGSKGDEYDDEQPKKTKTFQIPIFDLPAYSTPDNHSGNSKKKFYSNQIQFLEITVTEESAEKISNVLRSLGPHRLYRKNILDLLKQNGVF